MFKFSLDYFLEMHKIILFFALTTLALAEYQHTNVYANNWDSNKNYYFFDPNTFGINVYDDPCTPININQDFRAYVNKNVKCDGMWCIDSTFKCGRNGNTHCYHVEHIIDINGPEFGCDTCKNIAANLVMAWGRWNMALGGMAKYDYNSSSHEKSLVYGEGVMSQVRLEIERCQQLSKRRSEAQRTVTVDPYCETDADCSCDSDADCGCDCSDTITNDDIAECNLNNIINLSLLCAITLILIILGIFFNRKLNFIAKNKIATLTNIDND
jgi:hypothetical protein